MSQLSFDSAAQLDTLLSALHADTITPAEGSQLIGLLCGSVAARAYYLEAIELEVSLRRKFSDPDIERLGAGAEANPEGIGDLPKIEVKPANLLRRHKRYDLIHWQLHKFRFSTFSAVMTIFAWVGFSLFVWLTTTPDDSRPKRDGIDVNFVARITGRFEHGWADGMREMPPNAFLVPGEELNLVEGFIEITFFDGAVVVLEGPTEFVIDSPGAGTLDAGSLAAVVPEGAEGFTIRTPTAVIVDLGTAFGVHATASGTEVHVFKGQVEYTAADAPPSDTPVRLSAGEAVRIAAVSGAVVHSPVDREQFIVALPGRLQRDLTSYEEIVLADGPVAYWPLRDRGIHVGHDLVGNHHGNWHGSAPGAVSGVTTTFDGQTNYIETPFAAELNPAEFTVELWAKVTGTTGTFRSPLTSRLDAPGRLSGFALYAMTDDHWALFVGGETHGPRHWYEIYGTSVVNDRWTHLAVTIAADSASPTDEGLSNVRLYVDGELAAEQSVPFVPSDGAPFRIGAGSRTAAAQAMYFFDGQIADVAVYDRALTSAEVEIHRELGEELR